MTDRKPLMAGNWKMHHTHLEAIQVVQKLSYRLEKKDYDDVDVVVCPAFTALRSVQTTLEGDRIPIGLGAQNCYFETQGAFTGEVSAPMLAKLHVQYVIVGHSERREIMGETDEIVAKKLRAVLAADMQPIVCVGETLERARGGRDRRRTSPARCAPRSRTCPPTRPSDVRGRVRADLGDRHRPQRHPRRRQRHDRCDPVDAAGDDRRRPPTRCGSSTAAA